MIWQGVCISRWKLHVDWVASKALLYMYNAKGAISDRVPKFWYLFDLEKLSECRTNIAIGLYHRKDFAKNTRNGGRWRLEISHCVVIRAGRDFKLVYAQKRHLYHVLKRLLRRNAAFTKTCFPRAVTWV
jgi:hypothetical protein